MNKTTTLVAPNDFPAGVFEVGEGSGNGGDGGKDGFFAEKENTQLENSDEENGDDDLELEERLPSLGDGFYEIEAIRRKRYRKVKIFSLFFLYFVLFSVCLVLIFDGAKLI